MSILEKLAFKNTTGFIVGTATGTATGAVIPYLIMKKKLRDAKDDEEREKIKDKYIERMLLLGRAGALTGAVAGSVFSNRKKLRNFEAGLDKVEEPTSGVLGSATLGAAVGMLPGVYKYTKSKTDEERDKAKLMLYRGATIGGFARGSMKIIKNLDRGLKQ